MMRWSCAIDLLNHETKAYVVSAAQGPTATERHLRAPQRL